MMKLKITEQNADKINAALDAVNGKATAFTISSYSAVASYAADAEKRLASSQLPKAERSGAVAQIRPSGPTANAYKYAAKSTEIRIERGSQDWFLVGVATASVFPKQNEFIRITITAAQRDTILKKAVEGYHVAADATAEHAA